MDFTSIWQENKIFVTLVAAGLLVLLIGQSIVSGLYPVSTKNKTLARSRSELRLLDAVSSDTLGRVRDSNETHSQRYREVVNRVGFTPRKEFLLKAGRNTDIQYIEIVAAQREQLVEAAKINNITVDSSLGMPEMSPTKLKEIQRSLMGLDIVNRVVVLAIGCNVREVGTIELVRDTGRRTRDLIDEQRVRFKMRGTIASIASLLERLQFEETYLALERAELEAEDEETKFINADITLSALTFAGKDPER